MRFTWMIVGGALLSASVSACSSAPTSLLPGQSISRSSDVALRSRDVTTSAQQTVSVDVRQYMAATIANADGTGNMLCQSPFNSANEAASCLTSFYGGNDMGEVKISYGMNNGIVDYIGISSDENNPIGEGDLQYIGVIRNLGETNGLLRCFTKVNSSCTAPANSFEMPEGMPYLITALPVVSAATEAATENPQDQSPNHAIPGALVITPNSASNPVNFYTFAARTMNPTTCAQTLNGNNPFQTQVVYVQQIDFGGSVGYQDAIVVDGFAQGSPNHMERYFYVKGMGRVRESKAYGGSGTSGYTYSTVVGRASSNIYHNLLEPLSSSYININTGGCPQGSAVSIY